jgi:hypothetical protein
MTKRTIPVASHGENHWFRRLVIGATISLVFSAAIAVIKTYLPVPQPRLAYRTERSDVFNVKSAPDKQLSLLFLSVRVWNFGGAPAEDVVTTIEASLVCGIVKVLGVPPGDTSIQRRRTSVEVRVPYLNPNEGIWIQFLETVVPSVDNEPTIQVRARGVNAHAKSGRVSIASTRPERNSVTSEEDMQSCSD